MSRRTLIWLMCCMILAAAFCAGAAYKTLIPADSSLPEEIYAMLTQNSDSAAYYLKSKGGQVAVYADRRCRKLLELTDIDPSTLRRADRAMLERGIPAENGRELLELLEDLGS